MVRAGGPLRVSQLAAELDILPRSATSVADELEENHLIERGPDRRDRRAVLVTLTTEGAAIASDLAGRASSAVALAIADLPQSDQEHLTATLTKVVDAVGRPARASAERADQIATRSQISTGLTDVFTPTPGPHGPDGSAGADFSR